MRKKTTMQRRGAIAMAGVTGLIGTAALPAEAKTTTPDRVVDLGVYPPWQDGRNNDAIRRGLEFTISDADNLADFHGDPQNPLLSLYVGGNYFFAMAPLAAAFEQRYPEYCGRLYWETILLGLLARQMKAGGTITVGNMTWTVKPDVHLAGYARVSTAEQDLGIQEAALRAAGCQAIRSEKKSGIERSSRTELQVLLDFLRNGDTLVVTRIDRLARSMKDLQDIVREMKGRGVALKATEQPTDTGTAAGKAFLDML